MTSKDINVEESRVDNPVHHSSDSSANGNPIDEKPAVEDHHVVHDEIRKETAHNAAERGHAATDK